MATETTIDHAASLPADVLVQFSSSLRGVMLTEGDPRYDDARKLQNGMIDRRPAFIVACHGTADVVEAVKFARDHGLHLSVRGGGHNFAGNAMNDGGLVIDLSRMRSIHVDAVNKTVRAGGGATWGDVDRESQLFGLAVPGGVVSTTGVGGLTLHGGLSHIRRKFGLTIDNLVEVEIVLADGRVLTASENDNTDLFWAIRGAGSNFGVVTSFVFRAHDVGPVVQLHAPGYALEDARTVIRAWQDYVEQAPDEVSSLALFWSVPDIDPFPAELRRKPVVILAGVYAGSVEDGARTMQPLRELATPMIDLSHETSWVGLQASFDPFFPKGRRYYWKSTYIDTMAEGAVDTMVKRASLRPSPLSSITFWHLGGAIGRVAADATAYRRRDAPYLFTAESSWDDPAQDGLNISWSRDSLVAMSPFSNGGLYLNFAGFGEEKDALLRSTYGANYDRLVKIKSRYDPMNLFHMNQNIVPLRTES